MTHEEEFCEALETLIERHLDLRFAEQEPGEDGYLRKPKHEREKLEQAKAELLRVVKNEAIKNA